MIRIINDIKRYFKVELFDETNLSLSLEDVYNETNESFIFIIDEWDCIFRECKEDKDAQENYLDNLLLVGISYDKDTKEHSCVIEKYDN